MRRSTSRPVRSLITAAVVAAFALLSTPTAAGGTWLQPTKSSYEPGDEVVAVAYVGASVPDKESGYIARINLIPLPVEGHPVSDDAHMTPANWRDLGAVSVEPTRLNGYLNSRVSIRFEVPAGLEPGQYEVAVRDESGRYLGDLIGMILHVGIEAESVSYEWPLDEPLISELPDHAVVSGPGFSVPVADLRAGRYPVGAEQFALHPEVLPSTESSGGPVGTAPSPRFRGHYLSGVPAGIEEVEDTVEASPATVAPTSVLPDEQLDESTGGWWVTASIIVVSAIVGLSVGVAASQPGVDRVEVEPDHAEERDAALPV